MGLGTVLAAAAALPASAIGLLGWTPYAGVSSGPDQFVVGAHLDFGELVPSLRLGINGDAGFGDDITLVTAGPTVLFHLPVQETGAFYAGGAFALTYWNFDVPDIPGIDIDDSETDFGIAGVVGYMHAVGGGHLVGDLKFELSDYPDVKVTAGYRMNLAE
jgi:hypothetical protein